MADSSDVKILILKNTSLDNRYINAAGDNMLGNLGFPITSKTTDYTLSAADHTCLVTCSSADITITLPPVGVSVGKIYNIKKIDATGYTVIVDGDGSETIDGDTTVIISGQYDNMQIQSDGSNWYII